MRKLFAILVILALLSGCDNLRGNSRSYRMDNETKYLAGLSKPIDIGNAASTTAMLEKQILSQNIILAGEVPGVSGNAELQKYFFEAFNGMTEIDYLIAEIPYSAGEILNNYFDENNEASLDKVFLALEGKSYAIEENRSFFRQLKLLLKSKKQTVKIIGIDVEYAPQLSLQYLADVVSKKNTEAFPIAQELADARDKDFTQADYLELSFKKLLKSIRENPEVGKQTFGNEYDSVLHVLESLEVIYDEQDVAKNEQFNHDRSDQLVSNFLKVYDKDPEAMYFGQLANPAVMQSTHLNYDWFASAIQNERESAKGNVISLLYTYENCQRMIQLAGRAEKENLDLFKFDNKTMLSSIDQPYTLISLIEKDSLFNEESIIFEKDFNGAVTEYFQYLVVLNESPASKALK